MAESSSKVRIRTADELASRKRTLFELSDLLGGRRIRHFLCLGALLGAVRERSFIPWDWDVEIGVYTEEVIGGKDALLAALEASGFTILKTDLSQQNFKIDVAKHDDPDVSSYSITGWHKEGDMWLRNRLRVPERFFDDLGEISFLGRQFKCPRDAEGYLAFQYGADWRTPKRTDDQDEYWTRAAFPQGDITRGGRLGVFVRRVKKAMRSALGQL